MQTICFKAAETPRGRLSNCSLAVQSIEKPCMGQTYGKEHISSPRGVRGPAKTETSRLLATYCNGWEMPVQLHLTAWVDFAINLLLLIVKSRMSPVKSLSDEKIEI